MSTAAVVRLGALAMLSLVVCGIALLHLDASGIFDDATTPSQQSATELVVLPKALALDGSPANESSAAWASDWVSHVNDSDVEVEFDLQKSSFRSDLPHLEAGLPPSIASLPLKLAVEDLADRLVSTLRSAGGYPDADTQQDLQIVVDRLNSKSVPLTIRLSEPSVEAARRLAVRTHAQFVEAGLDLSLVDVVAVGGPTELLIDLTIQQSH